MSDPVAIIGAGFLGSFATVAFNWMRKQIRPNGQGQGQGRTTVSGRDHDSLQAEVRQLRHRLGAIEGTLRGRGIDIPDVSSLG